MRIVASVLISIALCRVGDAAQIERRFMETVDACGNLTGLKQPQGVAVDRGGRIYVSDTGNNRVLRITPPCQVDRLPLVLEQPVGLATDAAGNVYVTERGRHNVWKIDIKGDAARFAGTGHRGFAGDGAAASAARLSGPTGVAVASGGTVFIADRGNNRIRAVSTSGVISTVAGTGKAGHALDESHRVGDRGPATRAPLNKPTGVAIDRDNNLFVTDQGNWRIRRIAADGRIDTLSVLQRHLTGIAVNTDGNVLYTNKNTIGLLMRNPPVVLLGPRWNINTPFSPVAPSTVPLPTSSVSGWGPNLYAGAGGAGRGGEQSSPEYALFNQPQGIAVDQQGLVLIADTNNNRIRRVARCSPPPAIVPRHCNQEPNAGPSSPSAPSVVSPPQGQPQSQKVLVPVPLAPAARAVLDNGCTNQSADFAWEFTWSGVPGAARYHLQVLGPTATVFLIDIPTIKGPSYRHYASRAHIAAPNLRGWKWKVRALIGSTWTDWSTEQTFDVEPPRVDCLG